MKPAPFKYYDPETTSEVIALLKQYGDDAKLLAGGQSLGPVLNMRLSAPEVIIDLNRVDSLRYVKNGNGSLHLDATTIEIGAMTLESTLEDDALFSQRQPLIAAAIPFIGHRAIRNRGTVGGSLVHADPAAEWPMLAVMLGVEIELEGANFSKRVLSAKDFYVDFLTTAVNDDELVTGLRLPAWPSNAGWSFVEFSRRHGDFAIAGIGVQLQVDANNHCRDVKIGLLGVHPIPCRAEKSEAMLHGQPLSDELLVAAAQQTVSDIEPGNDIHASATYRRYLTITLAERALKQAYRDSVGKRSNV